MLNGVVEVIIDINAKRVAVEYDEERLSDETIKGTIDDAGFEVK
jgi:copper chaperone CopZ